MSETSMHTGSGTQVSKAMESQRVKILQGHCEKITTTYSASGGNRIPVQAADATKIVVVRVNTELLSRQKKTAEANASIRRRSRS